MNLLSAAILSFAFSLHFSLVSQTEMNQCKEIDLVLITLNQNHFQPIEITEEVKKEIVFLYIQQMDANNRFINLDQIKNLQSIAIADGLCASFKQSEKYFYDGVKIYDSLIHIFTKSPVKFKKSEIYRDNYASSSHLRASKDAFNASIIQMFKYDYLYLAFEQSVLDSIPFVTENQLTLEFDKKWRDELLTTEEMYIQRILEDKKETSKLLFEQFLNAITMRFDPHSNYFSVEEMEVFEEGLSRETTSFGLQLAENDDYEIEVTLIIPGSSAWFSGEFKVGDIVENVTLKSGEVIDFNRKGMNHVFKVLKNQENNELTFSVRRKSGERENIQLSKTEVENIDNAFRGYIMEKEEVKLGYISLPSFYTDFESDAMLGCANDVAKEIILLKKEGIKGLVLDLRNNGGGSIKEAVELCGLFISEGPICVLEVKEKKYLLKDMNRGLVYDGPLVILVNGSSASASEVVSGCLQDYGRALVVGDLTYGKGTAQSVYDVQDTLSTVASSSNGQVKVTDGKFYHISQRSNQSLGIVPDILVKDIFGSIDFFKEKYMPFHLANDSTQKKVVFKPYTSSITQGNIEKSQRRINQSNYFSTLKYYADSLKNFIEEDQDIPMEFIPFMQYKQKRKDFMIRFYEISEKENTEINVSNHAFVEKILALNPLEKKMNDDTIEGIKSDAIIQESLLIFKEIYTFETNK